MQCNKLFNITYDEWCSGPCGISEIRPLIVFFLSPPGKVSFKHIWIFVFFAFMFIFQHFIIKILST